MHLPLAGLCPRGVALGLLLAGVVGLAVLAAGAVGVAGELRSTDGPGGPERAWAPHPAPAVTPMPPDPVPHVERPEAMRGIYLNAWQSGSSVRVEAALGLAR
ncbi:MAG: hypothetical protein EA352_11365, partial [Gemmatimonadales bacterium]